MSLGLGSSAGCISKPILIPIFVAYTVLMFVLPKVRCGKYKANSTFLPGHSLGLFIWADREGKVLLQLRFIFNDFVHIAGSNAAFAKGEKSVLYLHFFLVI